MRILAALTLVVSSGTAMRAEDWAAVHTQGIEAVKKGDFENAGELFRKSRDLARTPKQIALSDNDLGVMLHQTRHETEAKASLRQALDAWAGVPDSRDQYAQTAGALAAVDRELGEYAEATALLRDTLNTRETAGDPRSYLLSQLGDILREQGDFDSGRALLKDALGVQGISWRQRLDAELALAELDRDTQNWSASLAEWGAAAESSRRKGYAAGEGAAARGLGRTWLDQGNAARAEPLLKQALAIFEGGPARDEAQEAATLSSLGDLYMLEGKAGLAEEAYQRSLQGEERDLGPTHPQVALVLEALAGTFSIRNEAELSRDAMNRAEKIFAGRFGERSKMMAGIYANRGGVEERLHNPDGAAEWYRKALDAIGADSPNLAPLRARVLTQYAGILKGMHRKREANALLAEAKAFR
jgi:Tfp pilus assembly protein PilF